VYHAPGTFVQDPEWPLSNRRDADWVTLLLDVIISFETPTIIMAVCPDAENTSLQLTSNEQVFPGLQSALNRHKVRTGKACAEIRSCQQNGVGWITDC
jgi:hypothetical protein